MSGILRIRYRDGTTDWFSVRIIHKWVPSELPDPVMSASGGPKELVRNWVWTLCKGDKAIDEVVMVRSSGPPFCIVRKGKVWFDVAQKELEVVNKGGLQQ